jgi:hypothetical protein
VSALLASTGCAAVAWNRIEGSEIACSAGADAARDAMHVLLIETRVHEGWVAAAVGALRDVGIEPILVKGLVSARSYARRGLRPPGDVDLCVGDHNLAVAREVVRGLPNEGAMIDLHGDAERLHRRSWQAFSARAGSIEVHDVEVRVPCPEDHVRICCLHLLRHGAWRPIWLCDLAAALESVSGAFDWPYLLEGQPSGGGAVAAALSMARTLLGADYEAPRMPGAVLAGGPPAWLERTVLNEWGRRRGLEHLSQAGPLAMLRRPGTLSAKWPNPIESTARLGARFGRGPRLPLQFADVGVRAWRLLANRRG